MHYQKYLISLLLFLPFSSHCVDLAWIVPGALWMTNAGGKHAWKSITQLEDITEFEGHVVAYETNCFALTSDICITLPGNPRVNFGYIQPGIQSYVNYQGETNAWYRMEPLLKWAWGKNTDIHNYQLEWINNGEYYLRMRLATREEKDQVLAMLRSERVCQFVHWSSLKSEWSDKEDKDKAQARELNEAIFKDLAS